MVIDKKWQEHATRRAKNEWLHDRPSSVNYVTHQRFFQANVALKYLTMIDKRYLIT